MFKILHLNNSWKPWWFILAVIPTMVSAYPQGPPHVIFIMLDDLGWNDVSFHGSDQILTPNIDTLAYQSVILQQYYSEAICTPARTALLTGKYPMRLGMHGRPLSNSEDRGIPLTERLLPSYMKELGYSTHLVGKWHVGMSKPEYLPTSRGYDHHYGMRGGLVDYYTYNRIESGANGRMMSGLDLFDDVIPQETEQRYIIDALTDEAVKIIQCHNSSVPLFLHVTHNGPHAGNDGASLQPPLYAPLKHSHIANSNRRLYAEIVTHLDRSIGKIILALTESGMLNDAIIIFVSDNGAPTVGEFSNWGVNLPFRGIKYTPWEAGVRVPAFIWQSSVRPRVWPGLMHVTDWLPTIIAATGGNVPENIDGINQWDSIIQGSDSKRKEVLVAIEDSNTDVWAAYRAGDYKIVIGNVTNLRNEHYGAELMINKQIPPEYYPALRACDVTEALQKIGVYLDLDAAKQTRIATAVTQEDTYKDATPCLPTPTRGCLFNIRRDPTESHDLWGSNTKIATLLTNRLRNLWAMQLKRGPARNDPDADPANFDYVWTPWVVQTDATENDAITNNNDNNLNFTIHIIEQNNGSKHRSVAAINCEGMAGLRNFLCILESVF